MDKITIKSQLNSNIEGNKGILSQAEHQETDKSGLEWLKIAKKTALFFFLIENTELIRKRNNNRLLKRLNKPLFTIEEQNLI